MSDLEALSEPHPGGWRELTPATAAPLLSQLRVIDVRQPDEFDGPLGHVEGAELVPLATLPDAARSWSRDQALLLVCRSGGRSGVAADHLRRLGFRRVYNLVGGMLVWNQCRLPLGR